MKLHKGEMIKIIWLDAFGRGSWNTIYDVNEGLKNHIICEIIGYYVKEDKNFLVLAMGLQNDDYSTPFLHLEFIPRGSIVKIKKLRT